MYLYVLSGIALFVISIASRVWVRLQRKDFGVDTWYHLNYAEAFRRDYKLPAKMKHYLLDIEEQWYPPFFSILLSIFPKAFLDRYHWIVSGVVDSFQAILLYIFSIILTGRLDISVAAMLLYISSTVNASMATNLNSRPLASLVSTLLMLSIYNFSLAPNLFALFLVLLCGAVLLHTHKMATQQFVFYSICMSLLYRDLTYIYILLLVFLSALIATKGFYLKILKNNIEIIRFWAKNLPYLLKHQVYASNLYANKNKTARIGISGLKMNKAMFIFARAQLLLLVFVVIIFWMNKMNICHVPGISFLFYWVFINYFTVITTTYLPLFKYIGEGFKYLIYGVFPVSFLVAYGIINLIPNVPFAYLTLFLLIGISFHIQIFTLSRQMINVNSFVDTEMKNIMAILKNAPENNIMCIPVFKAEPVAYFTDKRVLWGAHGSGWEKMDEFWPVIKVPLEKLMEKYGINYVFIDKRYVDIDDLKICQYLEEIFNGEFYLLFRVIKKTLRDER